MAKYFLGANSGKGFYSLYEGFCANDGDYLHLIKGGPGCGKSSFMRKIAREAEHRGYEVEYILCSGDPDSLDGIYIPQLSCGYVDATSPHVIEPRHFGVNSNYVNLGQFCSRSHDERIILCSGKYKAYYKRAYALLEAAAAVKAAPFPGLVDNSELSRIQQRARSAVSKALGAPCGKGKTEKRFIHCISCMGELVLTETVDVLCKQTYLLDNKLGLAKYYLQTVINEAEKRKDDIIICPSPLLPDVPEAVIFPKQQVGFIAGDIYSADKPYRHVRLDAIIPAEKQKAYKLEIKTTRKIYDCTIDAACLNLAAAKHWHDELEKAYRPYIDFDALDSFTESEIKKLFD